MKKGETGWSPRLTGYRGQAYWCFKGQLHAVVRENAIMIHRRFEVYHWSKFDSKHETLAAAKRRVMQLLEDKVA